MRTSLIVAAAENGTIGQNGRIPWHVSADLRYFKQVTMGAPVIMGRKTYESIGFALPGRSNIVVTRNKKFQAPDVDVVLNLKDALSKARVILEKEGGEELFVIGGAEIYAQAMRMADRIYLTRVHAEFPGDVFFPPLEEDSWKEVASEKQLAESENSPSFSFMIFERVVRSTS